MVKRPFMGMKMTCFHNSDMGVGGDSIPILDCGGNARVMSFCLGLTWRVAEAGNQNRARDV